MSWPFESWQQIAIRRFGLIPSEFWAMPVRDWLTLLDGAKPSGFDREALDALLTLFPDEGGSNEPER
ncbi:phage tail assembly chaperone [Litorimonas sp. WD9-15]|uniref:phage tail assembly chaperone n=1 Tax=Litorimonas sp. WD9-15 TaxID=3418716 RepID=UPI003CFCCE12